MILSSLMSISLILPWYLRLLCFSAVIPMMWALHFEGKVLIVILDENIDLECEDVLRSVHILFGDYFPDHVIPELFRGVELDGLSKVTSLVAVSLVDVLR